MTKSEKECVAHLLVAVYALLEKVEPSYVTDDAKYWLERVYKLIK